MNATLYVLKVVSDSKVVEQQKDGFSSLSLGYSAIYIQERSVGPLLPSEP